MAMALMIAMNCSTQPSSTPLDPMDAVQDYDHDGISNLEEYLDGSAPDVNSGTIRRGGRK